MIIDHSRDYLEPGNNSLAVNALTQEEIRRVQQDTGGCLEEQDDAG